MKIIPKKPETTYNTYMMKGELSGSMFVGLSEPYIKRHFLLTSSPTALVDLVNGQVHSLDHFSDEHLFHKVDGILTIK